MRVALFITCFNDTLTPQVGRATVRLLERLGHEVVFPEDQTCCGQMHLNTGYAREAVPLARRFVEVFAPYETIVTPSASCAATVRHHYRVLAEDAGDEALARAAADVGGRVRELSEFLTGDLGLEDVGATFRERVTFHPTCHSLRQLRVGDAPQRLLRAVDGIDLVELPEAAECCGFGGTFAVKNADVSAAMLDDKAASVLATGAGVVCAADSSCLLHIGGGLSRRGTGVRTLHLAEILAGEEQA